ncbi:MAG: hypothetical protein ACOCVF_00595 [bacterium]
MSYNDKFVLNKDNANFSPNANSKIVRTIYYGEVVSVQDETETGKIKVRIPELDTKIGSANLPDCYPLQPTFLHVFPKVGEAVRVFIEDTRYPYRGRLWLGSIISQYDKINYEPYISGISGTNVAIYAPNKAPSTYPNAKGVYPEKEDIAILGRKNNDIVLKDNQVSLRAGKHLINNPLVLNKDNPSIINLKISEQTKKSSVVTSADKIALLSTNGTLQYDVTSLDDEAIENIFNTTHPMVRGDVLVDILKKFRNALLNHIHPYDAMPATKTEIVIKVDNINLENILQKNIVIN